MPFSFFITTIRIELQITFMNQKEFRSSLLQVDTYSGYNTLERLFSRLLFESIADTWNLQCYWPFLITWNPQHLRYTLITKQFPLFRMWVYLVVSPRPLSSPPIHFYVEIPSGISFLIMFDCNFLFLFPLLLYFSCMRP